MRELTLDAAVENLDQVLHFLDSFLDELGCPNKTKLQLDVAVEELFVNIAHYAYRPGTGTVTIQMTSQPEPLSVTITLSDSGAPYDPLSKKDPDVTLPAEERPIGGLGIYMVKKSMDAMAYQRKDGQNVLTITKLL